MKIIKPQDLPFTSNIPEPDPNQGEAVYVDSESSVKPIAGASDLKSLAFLSDVGYATSKSKDWKDKSINRYSQNLSLINSGSIGVGQFERLSNGFFNPSKSSSTGSLVLVCYENSGGLIQRSVDGGKSFAPVNVGITGGFSPQAVVTTSSAAFCAYKHIIMKSIDSGASWFVVSDSNETEFSSVDYKLTYNGSRVILQGLGAVKVSNAGHTSFSYYSNSASSSFGLSSNQLGDVFSTESFSSGMEIIKSENNGISYSSSLSISFQPSIIFASQSYLWVGGFGSSTIDRYTLSFGSKTTISHQLGVTTVFDAVEVDGAIIMLGANGVVSLSTDGSSFSVIDELAGNNGFMSASDKLVFICGLGSTGSKRMLSGEHSICNTTNPNDATSINTLSITNSQIGGSETVQFGIYSGLLSSIISSGSVDIEGSEISNPTYAQSCSDGRYIYQLIKSSDWFVYKIDTAIGTATKLDLGSQYSGYIDNFSSNPFIFIVGDSLNVPINKSSPQGVFDAVLRLDKSPSTTVEIVPNKILSSKSVGAVYNADDVMWFLDNDSVELTDSLNFDSLGGYREGDEVISISTHRVYRATTNTVDTPEAGSKKTPPTWTDIGPTNKYAFRDIYIHNRTISQNNGTTDGNKVIFNATFENSVDSISFFGLQNSDELVIYYYDESGPPSMDTKVISLIDYEATLKTGEQTLLESFVVIGDNFNEDAVSARIELRPDDSGNAVAVGRMIIGKAVELGVTQYGAKLSIEDFSRRERDEFGNFTIVPRNTAKNIDFDVKIPKPDVNFVFTYLSKLTTIPCVFLGDDDDAAVQVYGYYSDYTHNIDYPSITSATISVEGLT